jgi:hypothetical protein
VEVKEVSLSVFLCLGMRYLNEKHDKQDQQGKAVFNERNPQPTQ